MDTNLWVALSGWIYLLFVTALVAAALLRKREPSAALGWCLAILFLPGVGPLLFLLTGWNRVSRRLLRKRGHRGAFMDRFSIPEDREHSLRSFAIGYPDNRWGSLGRLLDNLGEPGRSSGNHTQLYNQGHSAFEAMVDAIVDAKHHVHIEFYILRADELGTRLIELLATKCRLGVEVRLLVDAIGSWRALRLLRRLRRAGGAASTFQPLTSISRASPNLRNHRKMVICDGKVAFFGGMNVGAEYLGHAGSLRLLGRRCRQRDWYDLHVRMRGPAVLPLQLIFIEDWDFATGQLLQGPGYFPEPDISGPDTAQVIAGGPDVSPNPIRQAFLGAITRARREIYIATPYVVPDLALRDALSAAARAGVTVHIITQSWPPDGYLVYFCGQVYSEEVIAAGVRIHEFPAGMMHAKAIAVDGEWAMLGTANLDNRSMFLNFEQMTVFEGETVLRIAAELRDLLGRCHEVTAANLANRSWQRRLAAATARLFAPLL